MAAIKNKKLFRLAVVKCSSDAAAQIFAGPGGAQPFAFETQEGDLIEGINHPQAAVELQTIDDAHRIAEANMLRTQVAMPINDPAAPHALRQQRSALSQEPALHSVDVAHQSRWDLKAAVKKNTAVVRQAPPELRSMDGGGNEYRLGAAIELDQDRNEPIELPAVQTALTNDAIQHLSVV